MGDAKGFLTMFVRKKKHRSGNVGVIVVEKVGGRMKKLATIGVAHSEAEADNLVLKAKEWISKEEARRQPRLDLFGEERGRLVSVNVKKCPVKTIFLLCMLAHLLRNLFLCKKHFLYVLSLVT